MSRLATISASLAALLAAAPAYAIQTRAPAPATPSSVKVETVARGLVHPWGLQFLPDGRLLVTERPGRLRVVTKDGKLSEPIAGVPAVAASGQGGLLDVALSPDFATSKVIFFSYAEPRDAGKNGTSVARAVLNLSDNGGGRLDDVRVIYRQQPSYASSAHFGSRIVFARDGSLYITQGERYSAREEAQNPGNDLGKVVRVMPDGAPFAGNPKLPGWRPEIWSIGHRNVQGAALNPTTGELWTAEHGARGGDEINIPRKGRNYGWPVITYGRDYSGAKIGIGTAKEGMEQPLYYWDPSMAPSGAAFYTGDLFAGWKGNMLVGGLTSRALHRVVFDGETPVAEELLLKDQGHPIRDVRVGPDGAVWVMTDEDNGLILRVVPAS